MPEKDYEDGYGFAKIVKKHPEVIDRLQQVIDEMGVKSKSANRAILESADHKAAVRLEWNGETKHWLVSAYKKTDTSHPGGSTYGSGSKDGKPSPLPQDVSTSNIPPSAGEVKTTGVPSKASSQADTPLAPKASINASVEGKAEAKTMLDDPIETTGERILADNPDITYHAGTDETGEPVIRTAREVVDEARAEVQKAESVKDLFDMAVDCLRRG